MRALSSFFAIQGTRRPDTALISAVESWTILEDSNLRESWSPGQSSAWTKALSCNTLRWNNGWRTLTREELGGKLGQDELVIVEMVRTARHHLRCRASRCTRRLCRPQPLRWIGPPCAVYRLFPTHPYHWHCPLEGRVTSPQHKIEFSVAKVIISHCERDEVC